MKIVKNNYKQKHISELKIDPELKEILMTDDISINSKLKEGIDYDDDDDAGNIKEENNLMLDEIFVQELNPEIKSKEDIISDFNKNQQLAESLEKLKKTILNPVSSIKSKREKNGKKTQKKLLFDIDKNKNKNKHNKQKLTKKLHFGGAGNFIQKPTDEELKIIKEEKEKFGKFVDQISLKTEMGILPKFRIFEDKEENILACIFYGFYMRLGVNYYKNKYLVKLSKIDAGNQENSLTYDKNKKQPSLIVYQNLTISDSAKFGIVSEITPRIINSFI